MSYEGYVEYLCYQGHLTTVDAYDDCFNTEFKCWFCGEGMFFQHHVDQTNGVEYDEDGKVFTNTEEYPFEEVGFDDAWRIDHHGNEYATKIIVYKIPEKLHG